jgi:hypothetical protein
MNRLRSFFSFVFNQQTPTATAPSPSVDNAGQRNSMRSTRKRTAVKLDDEFVDVDSDELEQMMEEVGPASRKKQTNSRATGRSTKRHKTTAAAAAAAAAGDDVEDYQPDGEAGGVIELAGSEADSAAGNASQVPGDSADSDSDLGASSDPDEDYDGSSIGKAKGKQQAGRKKKQATEKKPRKKRLSTRRLCVTYAKQQYKLNDNDLEELTDVEFRVNPHYARE